MLQTVIHAVAASPLPSGELESPDPGVGEAEVLFEQAQMTQHHWDEVMAGPEPFLGVERYLPLMDAILAGLGIPKELMGGKEEQAEGVAPGDSPDGAGAGDGEAGDGGKKSGQPESPAG